MPIAPLRVFSIVIEIVISHAVPEARFRAFTIKVLLKVDIMTFLTGIKNVSLNNRTFDRCEFQ